MNMNKHRAPISLWTMAAAILALGIAAAPAQQIPAGSYQKTCSNISVGGTTLNADCKTFNQQSIRTSLPYFASCVGDIGNINGTLACAGPELPAPGSPIMRARVRIGLDRLKKNDNQ